MVSFFAAENFIPDESVVTHGFFGRQGGVSSGIFSSLNCGFGTQDSPANITENRRRVSEALGVHPDYLISLKQIHSPVCLYVDRPWSADDRPEADAFVTDSPGIALAILTADCGPVLFYGEKADGKPMIGAAHAGWRGAVGGVMDATIKMMIDHGVKAESIRAAIGPCLGPQSYEVGMDFMATFLNDNPESTQFFQPAVRPDHMMFDLPGYIENRLTGCGVRSVFLTGVDTYPENNGYFSYRRTTHRAETGYGCQISGLVIRP